MQATSEEKICVAQRPLLSACSVKGNCSDSNCRTHSQLSKKCSLDRRAARLVLDVGVGWGRGQNEKPWASDTCHT